MVLQNYMFERFLVRFAASPWRERFVLKGGLLVAHLHGLAERYSRETILAEKIESVLTLSVYGTRPRDYYDLWLLSGDAIRGNILRDALCATCRHRGTEARLADARARERLGLTYFGD